MQTVRWTEEATTDLVEIIDYIEQRNAAAAQNLFNAIVRSAESLPLMPYLFRLGRVAGTREHVVHPNYIVVYQVGNDVIDILRISITSAIPVTCNSGKWRVSSDWFSHQQVIRRSFAAHIT